MKKILLLLFILKSINSYTQEAYYIIFINGDVFNQKNIKVKIGDKLLSNETITFTSKESFLTVLNAKGEFKISPDTAKTTNPNELITLFVKDNIKFHPDVVKLSSRAIGDEVSLENYFKPVVINGKEINSKTLIVDELKISLKNMSYADADNSENFFFLQWIDTNRNGVNKKLLVSNDSLILRKEDFINNGKLYSAEDGLLALGYVNGYSTQKIVSKITDIQPVFLSQEELKEFLKVIKLAMPDLSRLDLIDEVYTELYYLYGKPDKQKIIELL